MKDEGGKMKFVLNRINFILHPSSFILTLTPSDVVVAGVLGGLQGGAPVVGLGRGDRRARLLYRQRLHVLDLDVEGHERMLPAYVDLRRVVGDGVEGVYEPLLIVGDRLRF